MNNYNALNILDVIDEIGEHDLISILSVFSCSKNKEIEEFIKESAIEFAKKKIAITYLIINELGYVDAFFTLTHKAVAIGNEMLSKTQQKRLARYAKNDQDTNSYFASAFLIAQFGKRDTNERESLIDGNNLMNTAIDILKTVQREIGGGVVYLECENNPKLLAFYESDENRFRPFGERLSSSDKMNYVQLLRLF